jgi:S1-C subfamily serine protease
MKQFVGGAAALAAVLALAPLAQAAPRLGTRFQGAPQGGVTVLGVVPGGAAEAAGLEPGDTVLSINGQLMLRGAQAAEAVVASGGHVSLIVRKADGRHLQYEIDVPDRPVYRVTGPCGP